MIALQLLFFTLVSVTQLIRTFTEMGKLPENDVKTFSDFHPCQLVKISKHRIGDPVLAAKSGLRTGTSADKHSRKKRKRNPVDSNVKSKKHYQRVKILNCCSISSAYGVLVDAAIAGLPSSPDGLLLHLQLGLGHARRRPHHRQRRRLHRLQLRCSG